MKIGRLFPELLTPFGATDAVDERLSRTLRRLVGLTGAAAGLLVFRPPRAPAIAVTAGRNRVTPALREWLVASLAASPGHGIRVTRATPPGTRARPTRLLRAALGGPKSPLGAIALVGVPSRRREPALPADFPRELGVALERVWQLHRRTIRMTVLNDITRLAVGSQPLDDVFRVFGDGLARLVVFDSIAVCLVDPERGEFDVVDLPARSLGLGAARDARMALGGTLLARVVATGTAVSVPDLAAPEVPDRSASTLGGSCGYRSALLVPLASQGQVFGAVALAARVPAAFDDSDVEVATALARPLAAAIEQRRLLGESRRRAEELAALYHTSQLITARLDPASVLDGINRAVTSLIGSTACAIGLLDPDARQLVHVAAHGVRSEAWRGLAIPLGEGIIGRTAQTGLALRVDDIQSDPRSVRRDIDEREGIRSMLCVPLRVGGTILGVLSALSTRVGAFSAHHQRVLEAFAEQAGIAIQNSRLFEESERRARETRALLEAGRAVTASLDVGQTIQVIMEQAKAVLAVESCGLMTVDRATGDLVSVASLDLPAAMVREIRLRPGEGIAGLAVSERRPVQSPDLFDDPRVRYAQLPRQSGLRSMLAAPLRVGNRAIGAITVFRRDVHRFSAAEEELLLALADQAAIALEHARLYTELEGMVAERTRQLDEQRRFVEVVLETLPLGVFVLDTDLRTVRANREGLRVLGRAGAAPGSVLALVPPDRVASVEAFLRRAFEGQGVASKEDGMTVAGEAKIFRLTAAPFEPAGDDITHVVLLVEDITRAKRLEQQMLVTERLTTAGRLAAGVAHELNNPLATIAGCAEALLARTREGALKATPEAEDFRHYLGLIEEEAYRCKEITGSLLQFVREPGERRAPTDLNALVLKTVELLSHQSRFAGRRFVTELHPELPPVLANEGQLRQVFLGLAANALDAMEPEGRLTVRSRHGRGEVEVEFEDEGHGIPDEILPRIFDPFFTTKPPGQGTGLGLAIAQGIVNDHGGRIDVVSRPGKGSTFRVVLPA